MASKNKKSKKTDATEIETNRRESVDDAIGEAAKAFGMFESVSRDEITDDYVDESVESFEAESTLEGDVEISDDGVIEAAETAETSEEEILESELAEYAGEDIEAKEHLDDVQVASILESVLFATDRPQSLASIKQAFRGTQVLTKDLRTAVSRLNGIYAQQDRGIFIEEVSGGYQLRTKPENMKFLRNMIKSRVFKLSGPALEVLSIVAYKQPCTKFDIDSIRGVDSGHLLRGLMERNLCAFAGKSELPGKPMYYATTRKFLEIFGLRHLDELPSVHDIDQLIPEGIGDIEDVKKEQLSDVTDRLSTTVADQTYSQGEEELLEINDLLQTIDTSTEFFEEEKRRAKEKQAAERAQSIREAMVVGEEVSASDKRWLTKYDEKMNPVAEVATEAATEAAAPTPTEEMSATEVAQNPEPSQEPESSL